jgi:leader peptidase (prepilin peptidase) / N-methyltransferase
MLTAIIIISGLFVGSLLNLCIDRLPHDKSLNPLDLFCPSCEEAIPLYARIPLLGYILSGGKCTQCNAPVSLRYPAIELTAALVLYFFFRKHGISLEFFAKTLLALLLILISVIDLSSGIIPDVLTIGGLSIGFILAFLRKPFFFYQDALYGVIVCGGILFVIAFCYEKFLGKEAMGYGDITLLCVIGAFCGLKGAVFSLLAGSLLGTLIGIPIMLVKGKDIRYAIPFGPFLSLGALFFMWFGDRFVFAFLRFISGGAI